MAGGTRFWTGERVRLRAVEPGDAEAVFAFDQASETQRNTDRLHPPKSAAATAAWARSTSERAWPGEDFQFVIEARESGAYVGGLGVHEADPGNGTFSYGIAVGDGHRRCGYASEAVRLVLSYLFGERRYHRCTTQVYADNAASRALHRSLGFTEEGLLREQVFLGGAHRDVVVVGLLAREFEKHEREAGREPYFQGM